MPGYTMEYLHNGTIWNHVRNITNTYNSAGLLTESVAIHPQTGQNISKGVITYDAKGNRRSVIMYAWQNMGWVMVNGTRDSLTYNGANKILPLPSFKQILIRPGMYLINYPPLIPGWFQVVRTQPAIQ